VSQSSLLGLLRAHPALGRFIAMRMADDLGSQMLGVAVGWYVYIATGTPMGLAYVGLAQFAPNIAMALFAGHVADRFDRRRVIAASLSIQALALAAFAAWSASAPPAAAPVYLLVVLVGATRAFTYPATAALLPRLVGAEAFPRAVATASAVTQIIRIGGPAVGGIAYAVGGPLVFAACAALWALAAVLAFRLPAPRAAEPAPAAGAVPADRSVLGGIRFIRDNRLLLALISLDLFAVLLGGVSALLPIFAKDILAVGPFGLGLLRCAPGVGAALVGLGLAHRAIGNRAGAGRLMLLCVAGYGVATLVFALSTQLWLSLAALAFAGGFDMVSMVIRQTLVQLSTPDAMRGRVSAVNYVFVGTSFQLGEFESGLTAALFGTVPAAALGGLGTLVVVLIWSRLFPELRRTSRAEPVTASP
jgi:MFS family permease